MIFRSYAKINLFLNIFGKLEKKQIYNLQSLSVLINLYDEISLKKILQKKDVIIFSGRFSKGIKKKKNSILKTLNILRKKNFIKHNYKINIKKNIPQFSGLGGGTSNSYFLAKKLLREKSQKVLKLLIESVGTDVILFSNKQVFQKSIFKIQKLRKKINFYAVLVFPNTKCSTKTIYSFVKKYQIKKKNIKIKHNSNLIKILKSEKNDLQKIVENKYPKVKNLLKELNKDDNCMFSRLTGSGSVCYAVYKDKKSAKKGLNVIKQKFPKYWCVITKTI